MRSVVPQLIIVLLQYMEKSRHILLLYNLVCICMYICMLHMLAGNLMSHGCNVTQLQLVHDISKENMHACTLLCVHACTQSKDVQTHHNVMPETVGYEKQMYCSLSTKLYNKQLWETKRTSAPFYICLKLNLKLSIHLQASYRQQIKKQCINKDSQ